MTVTAEYLKKHFDELIPLADGQEIDVVREGDRTYRLEVIPDADRPHGNKVWGAMRGKLWIADDFDSPEVNEEIEDSFDQSELK